MAGTRKKQTANGTKYVLIDYENVQPKNLGLLKNHAFKVMVFIGATQTRLPRQLVIAMQALGTKAEYVEIAGTGPNALDFHIAYYIGELAAKDPGSRFHIISKDRGFDPLIRHLKGKKITVDRKKDLGELPELRISPSTGKDEKVDEIVKNLVARGQSRPRKESTLKNTINTLFTKKLSDVEMRKLISDLVRRKYVVIKGGKVTYKLPSK